MLSGSKHPETI